MIFCSKLKNVFYKIVTKSQVVRKFNVAKSRLHCITFQMVFHIKRSVEGWNFHHIYNGKLDSQVYPGAW